MKYLAAYALVQLSGKAPTKDAVKAVLKAGNVQIDEARLNELFTNFEGKQFDEIVTKGKGKLVSGGSAPAAGGAAPAKAAAAAPAAKKEEKKEEEEDADMGFGLFD